MSPKRRRLTILLLAMTALGVAVALTLAAARDNLVFFFSPSELRAAPPAPDQRIRIGGLVEEGSLETSADGLVTRFRVTDLDHQVPVIYRGITPDLFREGQGVVAEGVMAGGLFTARTVLAKHDENYMPKEVVDALKKSGKWQEGGSPTVGGQPTGGGSPTGDGSP